jgi:phage tail sheath gpL-like
MITFANVPSNARATGRFIESRNVAGSSPALGRKILVLGQPNDNKSPVYDVSKRILSEGQAWELYGRGSELAIMLSEVLKAHSGNVETYAIPLEPVGAGVKATGRIVVSGTATATGVLSILIGGKKYQTPISVGSTGVAVTEALESVINADLDAPFTANFDTPNLDLTARQKGITGNQIFMQVSDDPEDSVPAGLTVTFTAFASGASNPPIADALNGLADTNYTDVVCPYTDSANLTTLNTVGNSRYSAEIKRPFGAFVPNVQALNNYIATVTALNSQWITFVPTFASNTYPLKPLAYLVGDYSLRQSARPGVPIFSNTIVGLRKPAGWENLTYGVRNQIVNAGGSWIYENPNGEMAIGDLVTTRKKNDVGAVDLDWQFSEVIPNLQTKLFAMDNLISSDPFIQAVVVDDNSSTNVDYAIRPKVAKAFFIKLIDEVFIGRALSKNRDQIIASLKAEIDTQNGGRINVEFTDQIASGLKIIAVKFNWIV